MRNDLPLTVIGNLVDDPELRFTPAGGRRVGTAVPRSTILRCELGRAGGLTRQL
jgi:single-stranded DNA-binding protein